MKGQMIGGTNDTMEFTQVHFQVTLGEARQLNTPLETVSQMGNIGGSKVKFAVIDGELCFIENSSPPGLEALSPDAGILRARES